MRKNNPVRLRTKQLLCIYRNMPYTETLKKHIQQIIAPDNSNWQYIFKEETTIDNEKNVIIFIECVKHLDTYSKNLIFENNEPFVLCLSRNGPELVKYLILTFFNKLTNKDLITNISSENLKSYTTIIKNYSNTTATETKESICESPVERSVHEKTVILEAPAEPDKIVVEKSTNPKVPVEIKTNIDSESNHKKQRAADRRRKTIRKHIENFYDIYDSDAYNLEEIEVLVREPLRNARNFEYKKDDIQIPEELLEQIQQMKEDYKKLTKKLKENKKN